MLDLNDYTLSGFLNKPHGVQGELKFTFHEGIFDPEKNYPFLFLKIDGYLVPFQAEYIDIVSTDSGYVKFEDLDTNEEAAKYTGYEFYIENKEVVEVEASSFGNAIVGFEVLDQDGNKVGVIDSFLDIPQNPVIEVSTTSEKVMLPFHESLIINFSNEKKSVALSIAEGLLWVK